jgi:hypothetical protein
MTGNDKCHRYKLNSADAFQIQAGRFSCQKFSDRSYNRKTKYCFFEKVAVGSSRRFGVSIHPFLLSEDVVMKHGGQNSKNTKNPNDAPTKPPDNKFGDVVGNRPNTRRLFPWWSAAEVCLRDIYLLSTLQLDSSAPSPKRTPP